MIGREGHASRRKIHVWRVYSRCHDARPEDCPSGGRTGQSTSNPLSAIRLSLRSLNLSETCAGTGYCPDGAVTIGRARSARRH